jgi:hypothetical protein
MTNTTLKKYVDYFKHNPKNLWFKRKIFGWGWTPVKWQGWLVILIFIVYLIRVSNEFANTQNLTTYLIQIMIGISLLILIAYLKGEKPRWQWGLK